MVFNVCLNYLQNSQDAEEVTQDVFVKVHSKLDTFKAESELKTWVYRISVNQSLDFIKAKTRKKRFGFHLFIHTDVKEDSAAFSSFDHPGIQFENKEATEQIFRAINQLPERQKTALLLKSMEELSQNEIAEVMELSTKAVESLLSRARATLKEILKNNEG
ncbi:MAG: RNA polymerase sigma factor [Flavobacteriales bacterium]|nr:RNA polymerase sigma factor [Flavobacteriales bacterium]